MAEDNRIRWWWRLCEWWGHDPIPGTGHDWLPGTKWRRCGRCRRMVLSTHEHPRWTAHSLEG